MSITKPTDYFSKRVSELSALLSILTRRNRALSLVRLCLFLIFAIAAVYLANERALSWLMFVLIAFIAAFGILVRIHAALRFKKEHQEFLQQVNEEELRRHSGAFGDLSDGAEFLEQKHFYSPDLDLFGSNSLFQLLVRSRLEASKRLMARWLLAPVKFSRIPLHQEAITELSEDTSWRQNFTAFGMFGSDDSTGGAALQDWLEDKDTLPNRNLFRLMAVAMPIISLLCIVSIVWFQLPYQVIFFPVVVNLVLLALAFNRLMDLTKGFEHASKYLKAYALLFEAVEEKNFDAQRLKELKTKVSGKTKASQAISSLSKTLHQLQNRANILYIPFNILFALDLIWLLKADNWKRSYGTNVTTWFDAVHEIDVLSDLASYRFANPGYSLPVVTDEPFCFDAAELGHPLIPQGKRVSNDFVLKGRGKIGLTTGSNMSGKSTFLRTIGVNLVLAQMGAPVCAQRLTCSHTRIFTSMRTQDNLEESVSSFYAELSRIKQLLDSIHDKQPILFLLDEILKGTNSEDRHKGAIALIKQLNEKHAMGLISTHDLSLSNLEAANERIENFSFNSRIDGDEIIFDYKLSHGPCKSFNASKLMENMGIILTGDTQSPS